jgi:enolase
MEIKNNNNPMSGNAEVRRAIDTVQKEICELLQKMPNRTEGKNRIDKLMYDLDVGLRNKY